jgi:site-specific recombinase XerD
MNPDNLLKEFVGHLAGKGRSESTVIAYNKDIKQLFEYLKSKDSAFDISKLNTGHLEKYVQSITNSGDYTLKTVSRKINSLKTFCKYLVERKLIVSDVSKPIAHPEYSPQLPRTLSALEYRALRDTARSNLRLFTMVELLLQTGLRIGELSRLKVRHFDQKQNLLVIEAFSSNKERKVDLNEVATSALKTYLNEFPASEIESFLFQTRSGKPVLIRNIRTAVHRAFRKAGIKAATVNDIRNTFIVFQLENGIKISRLAEIVGHQKPTTTEKYLQLVEKRPKKFTLRIDPL